LSGRIPLVWTFHDEFPVTLTGPYDLERVMARDEIDRRWSDHGAFYAAHPAFAAREENVGASRAQANCDHYTFEWMADLAADCGRFSAFRFNHIPNGMRLSEPSRNTHRQSRARQHTELAREPQHIVMLVCGTPGQPFQGASGLDGGTGLS